MVRPKRSASCPASRLPIPPMAITANPARLAIRLSTPTSLKLASRKTGIQAHIA